MNGFNKLTSDLKKELENKKGTLKVISLKIIVDKSGRIIGRTEFQECMIFPRTLANDLSSHELEQIAEAISEGA
jgi:hypothetical protein